MSPRELALLLAGWTAATLALVLLCLVVPLHRAAAALLLGFADLLLHVTDPAVTVRSLTLEGNTAVAVVRAPGAERIRYGVDLLPFVINLAPLLALLLAAPRLRRALAAASLSAAVVAWDTILLAGAVQWEHVQRLGEAEAARLYGGVALYVSFVLKGLYGSFTGQALPLIVLAAFALAPPTRESRERERARKAGRNATCPCGSGRKVKHCCGA